MSTPPHSNRIATPLLALALSLVGMTISILLLREHLTVFEGDTAGSLFCGGGGLFDCNTVAAHPSSWLLGMPLPVWGILYYIATATLALLAWQLPACEAAAAAGIGAVLAIAALMLDAWLGFLMVTKIGAICLNCVSTYVLNVGLAIVFWRWDRSFNEAREWGALLLRWSFTGAASGFKIAVAVVALAGAITAFTVTRGAVDELIADAQDEAAQLLKRMDAEPPMDMTRFASLPAQGPVNARVQIVVASDFECSFCRALAARLDAVRAEFPNDVRIMFLNAPISSKCNPHVASDFHPHACWLARAGAAAAEQGRFWEYHDLVYRTLPQSRATERAVRATLGRAGINEAALDTCLAGAVADSVVARDIRAWIDLKMDSVPSLIINGHLKTGGLYPAALRTIVRSLAAHPS